MHPLVTEALTPLPRACAAWPGMGGTFKASADDFVVEELPAYAPSGAGEHLFVWVEKRDCAAPALLAALARAAGVRPGEVGLAGSKDARAVTRQWASVPATSAPRLLGDEGRAILAAAGAQVLRHALHGNKLRLGHSRGNRFVLTVRGVRAEADGEALAQMVAKLGAEGLPNFYGPQRFGPAARNVARGVAWLTGEAPAPRRGNERRFVVSAVQSALFNAALRARMAAGDVRQVRLGDVLQVVRSGGPFWVDDVARETARLQAGEVVPTGPMFGRKMRGPRGVGALEEARYRDWLRQGVRPGDTLSLYVHVPFCRELCWYCACHTKPTRSAARIRAYTEALLAEVALLAESLPPHAGVSHLHLGGGTPSILGAEGLGALLAGEDWLPRAILAHLLRRSRERPSIAADGLTRREREILRLVGRGLSNAAIGETLCLSTHTVKSHMHNLLRKTGAANRAEAALRFHAGQDLPG